MELLNIILTSFVLFIVVQLFMKQPTGARGGTKTVIDTSALMDGRVLDLAKTGFLSGMIYVLDTVVAEMQQIADGTSTVKRERARFGLDILRELQQLATVEVMIITPKTQSKEVDDQLRENAKRLGASLMTVDYNLGKVALTDGLVVLNPNELSQALRPPRLPGEKVTIKIVQKGAERDQGVGYLEDGTMVVVDHAIKRLHQQVEVTITRTLQTAAGKMCFADLAK